MLRSLITLLNYTVHEQDGDMGHVHDFFFDDATWTMRYLVVETGGWLNRRRVLIATVALGHPDWNRQQFPVNLTRDQVRKSPDVDTEKPVYRQHEIAMNAYYGWPHYWTLEPILVAPALVPKPKDVAPSGDPHLRSVREVSDYRAVNQGQDLGQVVDFIVEEKNWTIRHLVIKTGKDLKHKQVLLPVERVQSLNWPHKEVIGSIDRDFLAGAPAFDPSQPVNREHEVVVYDYYGRPGKDS
jgi:uncharacterized protein YrrD